VAVTIVLIALAFVGGYIPEKLRANRLQEKLEKTQLDLEMANLHRTLGIAVMEAQRNNFASASSAASAFFDGCSRLAQRGVFANDPRTQGAFSSYAAQRDEIIVQLAAADPQATHRLAGLYFTMQGVLARHD
jgi:glutamate-1-semialdehyde aminotransferase